LLILTPWPHYREIAPEKIAGALAGKIIVDPYAVLDPQAVEALGLIQYTLGRPATVIDR
jgi:UDPglucose 6-dehydrogenase